MNRSNHSHALHSMCRFIYELLLLLSFIVIALVPFHAAATRHHNISKIYGPEMVAFETDRPGELQPGDRLPVYRFHPKAKMEIGKITVSEVRGREILSSFDPAAFRLPMGRHGSILETNDEDVLINLGTLAGLQEGNVLMILDGRRWVGSVQITRVFPEFSSARILNSATLHLQGLNVSEFTVATQVAYFKNKFLSLIEIFLFLLATAVHIYFFMVRRRPLLSLFGDWLRTLIRKISPDLLTFVLSLLLWIPFIWFTVTFSALTVSYLYASIISLARQFFGTALPATTFTGDVPRPLLNGLYLLGSAWYFFVLFKYRTSPVLTFWNGVGFHAKNRPRLKGLWRDLVIWLLHLTIAYAFARTLFGFLGNNINLILSSGWPQASVGVTGSLNFTSATETFRFIQSFGESVSFILTHPPRLQTAEAFFSVVRYFLWSAAIIGCLFGYGHSIFAYLWGKRIRNLDYTVMGWVTNGYCYGPILGIVLWSMLPSMVGPEPVLTQGPLVHLAMFAEMLLNLFYTLTIWNLGKMFGIMTDKGVRTTGFYSVVRHPSYTLESLMFVVMFLNCLSGLTQWLSVFIYLFIYYVRSEREDNFMSNSNPEYEVYKRQTPFKFIPGVY